MFSDQRSHRSVLFFFFNFLFKVDLKQSLLEVNEVLIKLIFIQSPHKSLEKLSLRLVVFFKNPANVQHLALLYLCPDYPKSNWRSLKSKVYQKVQGIQKEP